MLLLKCSFCFSRWQKQFNSKWSSMKHPLKSFACFPTLSPTEALFHRASIQFFFPPFESLMDLIKQEQLDITSSLLLNWMLLMRQQTENQVFSPFSGRQQGRSSSSSGPPEEKKKKKKKMETGMKCFSKSCQWSSR